MLNQPQYDTEIMITIQIFNVSLSCLKLTVSKYRIGDLVGVGVIYFIKNLK